MTDVPIEDRLAIQALVAEYSFRCDTKQYARCGELFAEDGVFDETVIGLPLVEGRPAIHELFTSMEGQIEFLLHTTSNHRIAEFDGDTASTTTHLYCQGSFQGQELRIFGYYADDVVKRDGSWCFAKRALVEITPSVSPFGADVSAAAPR